MSKLFNLKKWLTIPDAAKHLSISLGEDVTEADILRLALDKNITISLNLINSNALRAEEVPLPLKNMSDILSGDYYHFGRDDATSILKIYPDDIINLEGLVDLPMLGSERLIVEDRYRQLCNEKSFSGVETGLVCVQDFEGCLYVIQEKISNQNYIKSNQIQVCAPIDISQHAKPAACELKNEGQSQQLNALEPTKHAEMKSDRFTYSNLKGLPADSILVVRTEAIRKFEDSLKPVGKVDEKRKEIIRVLALIKIYDKQFDISNMPGRKEDFRELCIGINKTMFQVAQSTFNDYLAGICSFGAGARQTEYYRNIAAKLG